MIKGYLVENTTDFVVIKYYVENERTDKMTGIVKVQKSDKSFEVIKKDSSVWESAYAHAVRIGREMIDSGIYEECVTKAWI